MGAEMSLSTDTVYRPLSALIREGATVSFHEIDYTIQRSLADFIQDYTIDPLIAVPLSKGR